MIKLDIAIGRVRNRPLKDYAGIRFDKLVGVSIHERDQSKENNHKWLFQCDCGNNAILSLKSVRGGHTKSCGCIFKAMMAERNTTHGLTKIYPSMYKTWKELRGRCNNKNDADYKDYGGRGIVCCERWNNFELFVSDMGDKPLGYSIDRIDVNGNYEPSNCRWADDQTQQNNKRNNLNITFNGETKTSQQWADCLDTQRSTIQWRLNQGWNLEKVFSEQDYRTGNTRNNNT